MHRKTMLSLPMQGAILATISALLMSILMSVAKKLTPDIPTLLIVFIRSLFGLLFSLPFLMRNPKNILYSNQYALHGIRIMLSASAMLCTYYTYRHLPLTLATSLGMTGALFTTVLAVMILKDKVDGIKWLCVLVGYLGTLFIIQPRSIALEIGIITALLANFFAGCSTVITKILSRKDSNLTIISYTNLGLTSIFGFLSYPHWQLLGWRDMSLLASCGVLGLSAHYCYLAALKKASPSFLAPFEYTRLLFAFSIGFLFFRELPNLYTILGSTMIITATYIITYRDSHKKDKTSTTQ
jgi:drug/metabolite transporter (DMT)-like permease